MASQECQEIQSENLDLELLFGSSDNEEDEIEEFEEIEEIVEIEEIEEHEGESGKEIGKTERNKELKWFGGYPFTFQKNQKTGNVRYVCRRRKGVVCKGAIMTYLDGTTDLTVMHEPPHLPIFHEADHDLCRDRLKERALSHPTEKPSTIVDIVLKTFHEDILLHNRTTETYRKMWSAIKSLSPAELHPKIIITDFESAAIKAAGLEFAELDSNGQLQGCLFHFAQSIVRNLEPPWTAMVRQMLVPVLPTPPPPAIAKKKRGRPRKNQQSAISLPKPTAETIVRKSGRLCNKRQKRASSDDVHTILTQQC